MLSNLPTTVIPLALVNIDIFTPQKELQTIGLTLASIINGINTLYNFSKKCEVRNSFSGKYADLAFEIDKILGKRSSDSHLMYYCKKYQQRNVILMIQHLCIIFKL